MPIPEVEIVPVESGPDVRRFVKFPWGVYRGDPNWVPPLIADTCRMLTPGRHPFHEHADVQCFIAERTGSARSGRGVVGRIAAIVNHLHNEVHGEKTGFFGFFETLPDPTVPPFLFEAAAAWLRAKGMEVMRGPASFSGNEEWGLLIDGFDRPPMVKMSYNPPEYAGYIESFGFRKVKDLVAYHLDNVEPPARIVRAAGRMARQAKVTVRTMDKKRFRSEVELIREIYNGAWEKNWGFVPMTKAEIEHMARELKPVVNPDLVVFAEAEGKPVGFAFALPDLNQALKKANGRLFPFGLIRMLIASRKIREVRVLTLGVLGEYRNRGVDSLMSLAMFRSGKEHGYTGGEFSWVLEDNRAMRRVLEHMGARVYKTYRLYDIPLQP